MYVGGSTLEAIWGNKFFPNLLDQYLALTGYDAQQTNEPANPNRPSNLWKPLPGDHGAHGRFDNLAAKRLKLAGRLAFFPGIALALAGFVAAVIAESQVPKFAGIVIAILDLAVAALGVLVYIGSTSDLPVKKRS